MKKPWKTLKIHKDKQSFLPSKSFRFFSLCKMSRFFGVHAFNSPIIRAHVGKYFGEKLKKSAKITFCIVSTREAIPMFFSTTEEETTFSFNRRYLTLAISQIRDQVKRREWGSNKLNHPPPPLLRGLLIWRKSLW